MHISEAEKKLYNLVTSRYIRCIQKGSRKCTVYRIDKGATLVGSYKYNTACAKIMSDILMQDEEVSNAYTEVSRRFIADMIKNTRIFRHVSPIGTFFSDEWYGLECLDRERFLRGYTASEQELASNSIYALLGSHLVFCRHIGKMLHRLVGYTSTDSHKEICFLTGSGGRAFAECLLRRFPKITAQIDDALENKCRARDYAGKFVGIALRQHDINVLRHPFLHQVAIKRTHTRFRDPRELPVEMSLLFYTEEPPRFNTLRADEVSHVYVVEAHGTLSDADIDEFLGYCYAVYKEYKGQDMSMPLADNDVSLAIKQYHALVHKKGGEGKRVYKRMSAIARDILATYKLEEKHLQEVRETLRYLRDLPPDHKWAWKRCADKLLAVTL